MNAVIILISICCTIFSVRLFRDACGSMSLLKLNTVSYVFYVQIVTSGLVGSVLLAIGVLDYHPDVAFISDKVKFEAWVWTMYSILAMPIGMILLNRVLHLNVRELFNQYLQAPIEMVGSINRNKLFLILLTIFGLFILAYVFYTTERVALYTLLVEGDTDQANIDRITSRRNYAGSTYVKNLLGLIVLPVIAYYSYVLLRLYKSSFFFFVFLINFIVAILMVSNDIQKAPIAFFVLGFAILEVFISKGISLSKFLFFLAIPVFLILIGYSLTTDVTVFDQFTRFNSAFYGRTFVSGYFGFPLSLELFPDVITEQTHMVGIPRSFLSGNMRNLEESARLIKIFTHPETIEAGTGNLYSGYYMGEAWANYGFIGLVIAPFIVGFVVQSVHLFLLLHQKNPWLLAFYCGITVKWVVGAGFVNFLYLKMLIWPLILYGSINLLRKKVLKVKG